MRHLGLVSRALDHLDYVITFARLRILDWMYGPEPPTPADQQREREIGCGKHSPRLISMASTVHKERL